MKHRSVRKSNLRVGYSLVELLVVLAIVAVLVGIVLPAVQKLRTAAMRLQCISHLKQIALAAHGYHDVHKKFPPAAYGAPPGTLPNSASFWEYSHVGNLAALLPLLEQDSIFREITDVHWANPKSPGPSFWTTNNWQVAHYTIAGFLCPSVQSEQESPNAGVIVASYPSDPASPATTTAALTLWYFPNNPNIGRTNYLPVAGYVGKIGIQRFDVWRGIFTAQSSTQMAEIADGSSHTLMYGEIKGGTGPNGNESSTSISYSWIGGNYMISARGLDPTKYNCWRSCWFQFSSNHTGIVNFAMADGSVRSVSQSVDRLELLRPASGMQDGTVFPIHEL